MKVVPSESVQRLETMSMKLEKVARYNTNSVIEDMKWLVEELKKAWLKLEKEDDNA